MTDDDPFAELPREIAPPPALKGRVQGALASRGLLRATPSSARRWLAAAAALVMFAAGVAVGMSAGTADRAPDGPRFALLLYEPPGFDTSRTHDELAAEYGAWAGSLADRFVAGDALGEQRVIGGGSEATGAATPTGYFILRAADWDAAMAIASQCPHLRHGGVVAVRRIIG